MVRIHRQGQADGEQITARRDIDQLEAAGPVRHGLLNVERRRLAWMVRGDDIEPHARGQLCVLSLAYFCVCPWRRAATAFATFSTNA